MINLDLTEVKERLITECPAFSGRVFISIPVEDLGIEQHESPVVFLYPDSDSSGDNTLQRSVRQRMTSSIKAEIVVRRTASSSDRYGQADLQILMDSRREVFDALVGWSPSQSETPFQHIIGGLKSSNKTEAHWADSYQCNNHNTGK